MYLKPMERRHRARRYSYRGFFTTVAYWVAIIIVVNVVLKVVYAIFGHGKALF